MVLLLLLLLFLLPGRVQYTNHLKANYLLPLLFFVVLFPRCLHRVRVTHGCVLFMPWCVPASPVVGVHDETATTAITTGIDCP